MKAMSQYASHIELRKKYKFLSNDSTESGSALILVLAVMMILIIIGISTLATTNSSLTFSGDYYKTSAATLASQDGISNAVNAVKGNGQSGSHPYANYPCTLPNSGQSGEYYEVTITYNSGGGPESCTGSTLGSTAPAPISITIKSIGWFGGTSKTPNSNAVTTEEQLSITDTATTVPAYAIYAGSGYYPSGQITIAKAQGTTTPPDIYAGTVIESTPNTVTGNPNGGSITTPGSLFVNGFANLGGGNNVISGNVYANGTIYIASGSKIDGSVTSYMPSGNSPNIIIENVSNGAVGGSASAYQKAVSNAIQSQPGDITGNTGASTNSSGVDIVNDAQPLPQPLPNDSSTSDPVVIIPNSSSCNNFFQNTNGSQLSTNAGYVTFTSANSGTINSATPLATLSTSTIFGWNSNGATIPIPSGTTPFQYLLNMWGTSGTGGSNSSSATLTIYAPSCTIASLPTNQTYDLSGNVAMFVNAIMISNGITIQGMNNKAMPPTLAVVAIASAGSNTFTCNGTSYPVDIGFVLTTCGGGASVTNIRPFFWTLGNFQTDNDTGIDGQIYAAGKVTLSNATTITFYPVANGVLTFLGKPQLSPTSEYLLK